MTRLDTCISEAALLKPGLLAPLILAESEQPPLLCHACSYVSLAPTSVSVIYLCDVAEEKRQALTRLPQSDHSRSSLHESALGKLKPQARPALC